MTKVDFEFMPGDKVKTRLGDVGFVKFCNIDDSQVKNYYVEWSTSSSWFIASSLEKTNENVK